MASAPVKVLVLGASGMLGHRLCRELTGDFDVTATVRASSSLSAGTLDERVEVITGVIAEDFQSLVRAVARARPDVVVNCVGIIKQTAAAVDPIPSITVNALLPHRLANLCGAAGARMVHLSTDCVFSGLKGDYTEDDAPDPIDLYGRTKQLGEVAGEGIITIRTSMIGRELRSTYGLLEWFLSQEGRTVRGFTNAIYSGFTTAALSREIAELIAGDVPLDGIWHVAADPISKYDLLTQIRDAIGLKVTIEPDDDFLCDRSLDDSRYRVATGSVHPSWPDMIQELARESRTYTGAAGA
jgi:dTDP-4-dehydrorhamnose reductase